VSSDHFRWILRRRKGIKDITYTKPPGISASRGTTPRTAYEVAHERYAMQLIPVVTAIIPVTGLELQYSEDTWILRDLYAIHCMHPEIKASEIPCVA